VPHFISFFAYVKRCIDVAKISGVGLEEAGWDAKYQGCQLFRVVPAYCMNCASVLKYLAALGWVLEIIS